MTRLASTEFSTNKTERERECERERKRGRETKDDHHVNRVGL